MNLAVVASAEPTEFAAIPVAVGLTGALPLVARAGYDGIELAVRDPTTLNAAELASRLDDLGLALPALGTGQAWGVDRLSLTSPERAIRSAAVRRVRAHVELAARFDAIVIIGLIRGRSAGQSTRRTALRRLTSALVDCARAAADAGVRLAIEPVNRYETDLLNTAAEATAVIDDVDADNVGLLLDTFHMNIEEASPADAIYESAGRIFHFHVADSNRYCPGFGHIDFGGLLQGLVATGFDGFVSGEFVPLPGQRNAAADAIGYLRSLDATGQR